VNKTEQIGDISSLVSLKNGIVVYVHHARPPAC